MSTTDDQLLQCYNKGCGQQFAESKNHSDACLFHPGDPFFHDAYKGWSCCQKKCTDFTEFLNIKGCTRAPHTNVKPPEPERPKVDTTTADTVITYEAPVAPKPVPRIQRPDANQPLVKLSVTVAPSLQQLLEKEKQKTTTATDTANETSEVVTVGTTCKNGGCQKTYEGEWTNKEICVFHSGAPVFHEGMKFWTCCVRRTSDFESFLSQEGCTTGSHVWIKKGNVNSVSCRHDWHQTSGFVVISLYVKGADPSRSLVEASPVKLRVHVESADSMFENEIVLRGVVDVAKSSVTMSATKVEVKLRKAETMSWDKLELPKELGSKTEDDDDISLEGLEVRSGES